MQMIGSFAEFERAMIRERTRAGLEAARAEGRIEGGLARFAPTSSLQGPCSSPSERRIRGRRASASLAPFYTDVVPTLFRTAGFRGCHARRADGGREWDRLLIRRTRVGMVRRDERAGSKERCGPKVLGPLRSRADRRSASACVACGL